MSASRTTTGFHRISHDRPLLEQHIDAYRVGGKLADPTVCPQCHAVFHKGRWQWQAAPAGAQQTICPACHRINDQYPAGYVTLEGAYFKANADEILRIVNHHAEHQRAEHPLKRLMQVETTGDAALPRQCIMPVRVSWNCSTTRERISCALTGSGDLGLTQP
jgi:hypothetical protein